MSADTRATDAPTDPALGGLAWQTDRLLRGGASGHAWHDTTLSRALACSVAQIDSCLIGIEAIAKVLAANELARESAPHDSLSSGTTYGLLIAMQELAGLANDNRERLAELCPVVHKP